MGTAETRAKNKFNKKNYDRLAVFVPKGDRELIKAVAKSKGYSMNEFILKAVYRELGKHSPF